MNIKKLSINLLVSFDALMTECSVSVAAKKCHITQAAMSNSLKQLRDIFDDPLFIRESKGIKPTSKATSLHTKVRAAITSIEDVFIEENFDPRRSSREFNLALSDHGENLILPALYKYLAVHAPYIKLRVTPYTQSTNDIERLTTDIDIAVGNNYGVPPQINSEILFIENAICVMRRNHEYANKSMTIKRYLSSHHIAVNYNPHSPLSHIDSALKKTDFVRTVMIYVTNLRIALELVKSSDLIGTFPKILLLGMIDKKDFAIKEAPFHVNDSNISLMYHKRHDSDPAHAWLINIIKKICQDKRV